MCRPGQTPTISLASLSFVAPYKELSILDKHVPVLFGMQENSTAAACIIFIPNNYGADAM